MSRARSSRLKHLLVAESSAMRAVVKSIDELGPGDAPVMIMGERGTGRELIARILHASGKRAAKEVVTVYAGSSPASMLHDCSEVTSRQTLLAASGGTLLIKELTDLTDVFQRKLLHLLAGETDALSVRVVTSCDEDLEHAVDAGVFDRALYQALSAHTIRVPPLRERAEDIPVLATAFVRQYAREIRRSKRSLSSRAFERLINYPWPGNVAQLKGLARRLVLRAKKSRIEAEDVDAVLPQVAERVPLEEMSFEEMVAAKVSSLLKRIDGYPISGMHEEVIARVERPMFELVLEHTGGNQLRAAEILGLSRNTLRRKLELHGVHARTKPSPRTSARLRARVHLKSPSEWGSSNGS